MAIKQKGVVKMLVFILGCVIGYLLCIMSISYELLKVFSNEKNYKDFLALCDEEFQKYRKDK